MITEKEKGNNFIEIEEYQNLLIEKAEVLGLSKRLEKENAELKAKCNLCYEDKAEKSNKAITELKAKLSANRFIWNKDERHKYQDKVTELEAKLVVRNGRILDLEEQLKAIKYLDKDTLEDFFVRYSDDIGGVTGASLLVWDSPAFDKVIIEILKLAIPSRDKIIEVLTELERQVANIIVDFKIHKEYLADEILKLAILQKYLLDNEDEILGEL